MKKINGWVFKLSMSNGTLIMPQSEVYKNVLKTLHDGEYLLQIKKIRRTRSVPQNNYYWFLLTIIANETGNDPTELHEHFKFRFLQSTGKLKYVRSTTSLTTVEFSDYIEQIKSFTAEFLHIILPDANEYEALQPMSE